VALLELVEALVQLRKSGEFNLSSMIERAWGPQGGRAGYVPCVKVFELAPHNVLVLFSTHIAPRFTGRKNFGIPTMKAI
jgi:hypothetical protein